MKGIEEQRIPLEVEGRQYNFSMPKPVSIHEAIKVVEFLQNELNIIREEHEASLKEAEEHPSEEEPSEGE